MIPEQDDRPSWDEYFLNLAKLASQRSHDKETKVGCVITRGKIVVSTGYNGFLSGVDNNVFPKVRPEKYDYMIHSEANAVANAARVGNTLDGGTCYCTHFPCNNCLMLLWQSGVRRIVVPKGSLAVGSQNETSAKIIANIRGALGVKLVIDEIE